MSDTALAPRRSALPDVPSRTDLEALSPADLWTLEERASEIQGACRELNDERLRCWVEVEGKTQTEVAKMVGRSQARISQRCSALGIVSTNPAGRPKGIISTDNSDPDDAEEVDGEVVEDDPRPRPRSQPAPGGSACVEDGAENFSSAEQGQPDPGPRVKCPTCGHMVVPTDIETWKE